MRELEAQGPDAKEEVNLKGWEEALPSEVANKFDIDFAHYDISIPSRPPTP